MKILSLYLNRPGHALETVANWYLSQGHDVETIRLPFGKIKQFNIGSSIDKTYDVVITAEPNAALGLLQNKFKYGKLIFWRLDYVPTKFFGLFWLGDQILRYGTEVWSIVPPEDKRERYVPYLLDEKEITHSKERYNRAISAGPVQMELPRFLYLDTDKWNGQRVEIMQTHWASRITDEELRILLAESKIGLALYGKEQKYKKYSDPSRAKKYLACGLPVIATGPAPFLEEMQDFGAGFHTSEDYYHLSMATKAIYKNFDKMSKKAYELAEKYIVSERWVGL